MIEQAVHVYNKAGKSNVVLVCEHASAHIPERYNNLGLDNKAALSHVAWDPGAAETARHLADRLDAILIESSVSRLIYDCNRPPDSPTAMPARSEVFTIPGNSDLDSSERQTRIDSFYRPFEAQLSQTIKQRPRAVLVTIHSFTPVYHGVKREVEIGFLHDDDSRLACAMHRVASDYRIELNEPYGPADGVTHTLKQHGTGNGLLNVMIEIRNDLIQSNAQCVVMAEKLERWLTDALVEISDAGAQKSDAGAEKTKTD